VPDQPSGPRSDTETPLRAVVVAYVTGDDAHISTYVKQDRSMPWATAARSSSMSPMPPRGGRNRCRTIVILSSGEVVRMLLTKQLVDELILLIHPLVLGDGQRLFDDGGPGALFELADTRTTTTGVIAATYRRTDHGPKGQAN